MAVGTVLSKLLRRKGVTVNEVANATGISPQTLYSMIKRDGTKADLDVLYRICEELDADIWEFFEEYREKYRPSQVVLSDNEQKLLLRFRDLAKVDQDRVTSFVFALLITDAEQGAEEDEEDEEGNVDISKETRGVEKIISLEDI